MLVQSRSIALGAVVIAVIAAAPRASAQVRPADTQTDARWQSWLGCWGADSSANTQPSVTCIVPVANSRAVDALTITRGALVNRNRFDATGRPHAIDGNGCKGTETVNWSANGRRVYVHADYTCGGGEPGTSTAIFAISQTGEWLRVEKVRSGGGAIVTVSALRPTPLSPVLSADMARSIEMRQRGITTARASAAAPITVEEIVDAVHNLDGDVVYAWLDASEQTFDFNATQMATLADRGVPAPVMQLVSGEAAQQFEPREPTITVGPVTTIEAKPEMSTLRTCPPGGCLRENPYSTYNGYEYNAGYGYPYPYPYRVYPYATYVPYVYYTTPGVVRRGQGVRPPVHTPGVRTRPNTPPARPVKPRVTAPIAPRRR